MYSSAAKGVKKIFFFFEINYAEWIAFQTRGQFVDSPAENEDESKLNI